MQLAVKPCKLSCHSSGMNFQEDYCLAFSVLALDLYVNSVLQTSRHIACKPRGSCRSWAKADSQQASTAQTSPAEHSTAQHSTPAGPELIDFSLAISSALLLGPEASCLQLLLFGHPHLLLHCCLNSTKVMSSKVKVNSINALQF